MDLKIETNFQYVKFSGKVLGLNKVEEEVMVSIDHRKTEFSSNRKYIS